MKNQSLEWHERKMLLLNISAKILPYVFGVAFSLGSYTYVGAVLTLVISAWFLALNWKEVLKDKWSLIVIGFFSQSRAKTLLPLS